MAKKTEESVPRATQVEITVTRSEGGWFATDHDKTFGWSRSVVRAKRMFRNQLRRDGWTVEQAKRVELIEKARILPAPATAAMEARAARMREVEEAVAKAHEATKEAVRVLIYETRLSFRDAGETLGLSHEAVREIANSIMPAKARRRAFWNEAERRKEVRRDENAVRFEEFLAPVKAARKAELEAAREARMLAEWQEHERDRIARQAAQVRAWDEQWEQHIREWEALRNGQIPPGAARELPREAEFENSGCG